MANGIRLQLAIDQIRHARGYTRQLVETVKDDDYFRIPPGCVSHIGWQVGHLAMAQYGLTMMRIRGKEPSDSQIITNDFFRAFKKGTIPVADPAAYPTPDEIRRVWDAVHEHSLQELDQLNEGDLQQPIPEPHAMFDTKLGSIFFCSLHEMLHAGQIGLVRRMLGYDPLR